MSPRARRIIREAKNLVHLQRILYVDIRSGVTYKQDVPRIDRMKKRKTARAPKVANHTGSAASTVTTMRLPNTVLRAASEKAEKLGVSRTKYFVDVIEKDLEKPGELFG
jgi:predicted DNA binding CopG/RHH family protein